MISSNVFSDWNRLLPDRDLASAPDIVSTIHAGKTILVTGAGGSIGSTRVRRAIVPEYEPSKNLFQQALSEHADSSRYA